MTGRNCNLCEVLQKENDHLRAENRRLHNNAIILAKKAQKADLAVRDLAGSAAPLIQYAVDEDWKEKL